VAFRDDFAPCPACKSALDPQGRRLACAACGGVFVTETELAEMFVMMDENDKRSVEARLGRGLPGPEVEGPGFTPGPEEDRMCPLCATKMLAVTLEDIPLERCVEHGIWFDAEELQKVLAPRNDFEQREAEKREAADFFEFGALGSAFARWMRKRRARKQ